MLFFRRQKRRKVMKKLTIIPIVTALVVLLSVAAYGASVNYQPPYVAEQAPAGETVHIPIGVMINGLTNPASVKFVDSVSDGNLPASWLAAGPEVAPVFPQMPFANSMLAINIPADTLPGTYNGFVKSSVEGAEGGTDPGQGTYIQITVLAAASCTGAPTVSITDISPKSISVPNNKDVDVTVKGEVVNADGCSELSVGFVLNDEYGEIEANGPATVDGNSFEATTTVSASRKGSDDNGRTYQISITATNEVDTANDSVNVTVGHDSRNKNGKSLKK
jgi:hypothetical protein